MTHVQKYQQVFTNLEKMLILAFVDIGNKLRACEAQEGTSR